MAVTIARPQFKSNPQRLNSPAPYAYDVNVSWAQFVPNKTDAPIDIETVMPSPNPAVIAGFPSLPTKYRLMMPKLFCSKQPATVEIEMEANFLMICKSLIVACSGIALGDKVRSARLSEWWE